MPEIVRSLLGAPELWVLALLVASLAGTVWLVRGERRRPTSYSRRPNALDAWRSMSPGVQAAHDTAVLDAQEAAAARVVEPPVVLTAELIVEAEYARTITER